MSAELRHLPVAVDASHRAPAGVAVFDCKELWGSLARRPWRSILLLPVDDAAATASVAASLAEAGRRIGGAPVEVRVVSSPLDADSAAQLVASVGSEAGGRAGAKSDRVIVAVPPLSVEPLGATVAQGVDAVVLVLCVGRTQLAAAQHTVDLVGRERLAGCLLVD
jgi:hypothetical protein